MENENKKGSTAQTMRQVAGWIYLVLCIFQMATLIGSLEAGFTQVPNAWLIEIGLMVLEGVVAVYMIGGTGVLKRHVRRGVIVGTILVVAFALITYTTQTSMLGYALTVIFPNWEAPAIWKIVLLLIRLVLLILAAFFVSSSTEGEKKSEAYGFDTQDETVVINEINMEETVFVEEEQAAPKAGEGVDTARPETEEKPGNEQ